MTLPLNDYDCACFDVSPLVRTRKSIKTFAIFFSLDIIHRLNVIKSKLKLTFKKLKIKKPDRGRKPNVENIIGRQWMNISVSSGCVCVYAAYIFFLWLQLFLFFKLFSFSLLFQEGITLVEIEAGWASRCDGNSPSSSHFVLLLWKKRREKEKNRQKKKNSQISAKMSHFFCFLRKIRRTDNEGTTRSETRRCRVK